MQWPHWWAWELELTPHLMKRMIDRGFNEADVRTMMEDAVGLEQRSNDRFRVATLLDGRNWIVIVEPDFHDQRILVISAYAAD